MGQGERQITILGMLAGTAFKETEKTKRREEQVSRRGPGAKHSACSKVGEPWYIRGGGQSLCFFLDSERTDHQGLSLRG